MNLEAVWHDLECAGYQEDLPLWRTLAAERGGRVLDVGAGTGRVSLDLARRGVEVLALDVAEPLLEALAIRAAGLPVQPILADAREFTLERCVSLIVVPMQTLQLLGGPEGRAAFLRAAREQLEPDGVVVAALADAMDCFDADHDLPPPPVAREILGVRYSSQLLGVVEENGRAAVRWRREIAEPDRSVEAREVIVHLDRVSADQVAEEAAQIGFLALPHMSVPQTEQYLGATVVALRAPPAR